MMSREIERMENVIFNKIYKIYNDGAEITSISVATKSSFVNGCISYKFTDIPKMKESINRFAMALTRFIIVTECYNVSIRISEKKDCESRKVISKKQFTFDKLDRPQLELSAMQLVSFRVKLIPDKVALIVDETGLHPWIGDKLFGQREDANFKSMKVVISPIGSPSEIKFNNRELDYGVFDIKDACRRYHPTFENSWLLSLIKYHDYLKNVVMGQMRAYMLDYTNNICKNNIRRMGDVDGNF